ncbi:hypothetical protein AB0F24_11440 [Streptomyces platensis]|uniref:hypothetical protein n=1 Tax=Streptomyces platensis TaxID=58346 RepID=UPI0033D6812D
MSPDRIATIPNNPAAAAGAAGLRAARPLAVLVGIAVSDILDGYLALRLRQVSRLSAASQKVGSSVVTLLILWWETRH